MTTQNSSPGLPPRAPKRVFRGATLLALALACAQGATAADLGVNWYRFGQQAMKEAPESIRKGPETDKARYLAAKVTDKYAALGVKPNTTLAGRIYSLGRYGKADVGACGNLTSSLEDALMGGGFKADHLVKVLAEKPHPLLRLNRSDLVNPMAIGSALLQSYADVNSDHGGLGVVIGGKVWVVDAWRHGQETGSFKGFDKSPERLMPLPAWGARMAEDGYAYYTRIETSTGNPDPKYYRDVNVLGKAAENETRSETAWSEPGAPPAPTRRAKKRGPSGSGETPVGESAPPAASEPAPYQGIVLWPRLGGSTWAGQVNAREGNEDGSADFVFSLDFKVDSGGNNLSGSFEFPMAHTPQGPVRQKIPCSGRYDQGTGTFTLTFESAYAWTDTTTVKPAACSVKVAGTFKGRVEADPNHQDLAQGQISGSRTIRSVVAGVPPVTATSRLSGSWRLQRR